MPKTLWCILLGRVRQLVCVYYKSKGNTERFCTTVLLTSSLCANNTGWITTDAIPFSCICRNRYLVRGVRPQPRYHHLVLVHIARVLDLLRLRDHIPVVIDTCVIHVVATYDAITFLDTWRAPLNVNGCRVHRLHFNTFRFTRDWSTTFVKQLKTYTSNVQFRFLTSVWISEQGIQ